MSALGRAGWLASAAIFGTLLASIVHIDYVGWGAELILLVLFLICVFRPAAGLEIAVAAIPVAWYLASRRWNAGVSWAEASACAVIAGLSLDAARATRAGDGGHPRHVPFAVAAPALIFGLLVAGSLAASLSVLALRLGPGFTDALQTQIVREYFVHVRGFPALQAGLLLIEGLLLFTLSARIAVGREGFLRRFAAAAAIGAVLAASLNIARLLQASSRGDAFFATLADMAQRVRWNVHYGDFNAAGSYLAMGALLALALAVTAHGARRGRWCVAALVAGCGLYLTSSRSAYVAGILALGGAVILNRLGASRRRIAALALVSSAAIGVVATIAAIAVAAPQRGNQQSALASADVRIEMAKVGGRMIARYPTFGIGLGEFYRRSGEFSPWALFEKFPVAVHENAHNNFVQVAAELGLTGGLVFAWLIAAALFVAARGVHADRLRLFVLAALAAFVVTWLAGHPLLVPEAAYAFWIVLGVAAGSASIAAPTPGRHVWIVAACCAAILLTVPPRVRATMRDADLEHVAIGLSPAFEVASDGTRYREGQGRATLFVPQGGFRLGIHPRSDRPVRVELRLDGRVADVVVLLPGEWNELKVPARTERGGARYSRLDLRVVDDPSTVMWITKVEPLEAR
jgi:O-antigen ligase